MLVIWIAGDFYFKSFHFLNFELKGIFIIRKNNNHHQEAIWYLIWKDGLTIFQCFMVWPGKSSEKKKNNPQNLAGYIFETNSPTCPSQGFSFF